MKVLAVIPALNEHVAIGGVVSALRAQGLDVVVIDDGSSDDTGTIARNHGAVVLTHAANAGIGAAEQTGLLYALRNRYDAVVRLDGDGQHDPACVPDLLAELRDHRADLVIGSRFLHAAGYRSTLPRRMGIGVLAALISMLTRAAVTDPTSGFRALNHTAIQVLARRQPEDYPEPESLITAHRAGCRIREIPVRMHARESGRSSIDPVASVYYMVKVILAIAIDMLRPAPSPKVHR